MDGGNDIVRILEVYSIVMYSRKCMQEVQMNCTWIEK